VNFFLRTNDADSKVTFKILEARLLVGHIETNNAILVAHNTTLCAGALAKYYLSNVTFKSFTFAAGSQSLSIDTALLEPLPKRVLFTLVKNKYFLGSLDSNSYNFRHYGIRDFALYVNGRQIPSEGLRIDTGREKSTVTGTVTFSKLQVFATRTLDFR
jgi:hypothetical protein